MKKETKEIVELTEKWMEKITELTSAYSTNISTIEAARKKFSKWEDVWNRLEKLYPFILMFLVFLVVYLWGCGTLNIGDIEYSKPCQSVLN